VEKAGLQMIVTLWNVPKSTLERSVKVSRFRHGHAMGWPIVLGEAAEKELALTLLLQLAHHGFRRMESQPKRNYVMGVTSDQCDLIMSVS